MSVTTALALVSSLLSGLLSGLLPPALPGPEPVEGAVWPLAPEPAVVAGFDPPATAWAAGHRGVDLAGSAGQPVLAARAGTVTHAGPLAGRGVLVVRHGGTRTTYEPVAAQVDVGDRVVAGQRLGVLELAGSHCFPAACLHWGWIRGETYLDPLDMLASAPVRLLPWRGLDAVAAPASAALHARGWAWR